MDKKQAFEQRFNIKVGLDTAQQRFTNRLLSLIDEIGLINTSEFAYETNYREVFTKIAFRIGDRFDETKSLDDYINIKDFSKTLQIIEALYEGFKDLESDQEEHLALECLIQTAFLASEVDLGI